MNKYDIRKAQIRHCLGWIVYSVIVVWVLNFFGFDGVNSQWAFLFGLSMGIYEIWTGQAKIGEEQPPND